VPAITKQDTIAFQTLFRKSYTYLNDNFHKFDERNKIQIAIAVCKMAVPQKLEGDFKHEVTHMASIQKEYPGELNGQPVNRVAEFDIGSLDSPQNT